MKSSSKQSIPLFSQKGELHFDINWDPIRKSIIVHGQNRQIYHVWTKFRLNTLLSSPYPNCNNGGEFNFDNILYLHPKFNSSSWSKTKDLSQLDKVSIENSSKQAIPLF
ncbi:MAG: hypothetical protein ACR2MI_01190 [Flavobacteriaceae bacterium]